MSKVVPRSSSQLAGGWSLLGRRDLLKGMAAVAGAVSVPGVAACDGSGDSLAADAVRFRILNPGRNQLAGINVVMQEFTKETGIKVIVNTQPGSLLPDGRDLQDKPDDLINWCAGFPMRYFAKRGLLTDVSNISNKVGASYHLPLKGACTGDDGKEYLRPAFYYLWAVFYRKSVWGKYGYTVPRTFDEYIALAAKMETDGLVPIGFAQKEGWPCLGTFDYLNLRLNGYAFHRNLLAGKEDWQGKRVRDVFDAWKRILPYQENAPDQGWKDAAKALHQGTVGMLLHGSYITTEFNKDEPDDIGLFAFPELNPEHGQDTVEAPIDGLVVPTKAANPDGAMRLLEYLATPKAQMTYLRSDSAPLAASNKVDRSVYNELQKTQHEMLTNATHATQFFDRDTDRRFAKPGATNAVMAFLRNPNDIDSILKGLADQARTILTDS